MRTHKTPNKTMRTEQEVVDRLNALKEERKSIHQRIVSISIMKKGTEAEKHTLTILQNQMRDFDNQISALEFVLEFPKNNNNHGFGRSEIKENDCGCD